jgi:periplasmic protein TonB
MKLLLLLTICFAVALPVLTCAQTYRNEKVTYLDDAGNPIKQKKATSLQQVVHFDDTLWEFNSYRMHGPRIRSFRSSDDNGTVLNGRYVTYSAAGSADTMGAYVKGRREGIWSIYNLKGRMLAQQLYQDGQLLWTKDTLQLNQHVDSLKMARRDSVYIGHFTKIEIESDFPGGAAAWLRYLNKNLRYPDEAVNNRIQGQVIIAFIVDTLGHIPLSSAWVNASVEYSLDEEALRVIVTSGMWTPAIQNGRRLKSYKRQPIIFQLK